MKPESCPHSPSADPSGNDRAGGRFGWFLRTWFAVNSMLAGLLALIWLVLRSGTKPSRLAYPCQQAALSAASLAFAAPLISAMVTIRRGLVQGMRTPAAVAVSLCGLLVTLGMWGHSSLADDPGTFHLAPPTDYRAEVFRVTDCPHDPIGDHFPGLDNLLTLMGSRGAKFYDSSTPSPLAGSEGIVAAEDVVLVKINYQWGERGGTNTDLLRGLIRTIVDHPDGFTGEVVVCENAQFNSVQNFDLPNNNAQNTSLSPHDVVVGFQDLGYTVSHYDWTSIRYTAVDEYSDGDTTDGYIVYDYDPAISGRVSYPKFQTDDGTFVSLRDGIWDPVGLSYDRERLKFINLPVLKSHHATYGVTACVKHYMGVVTKELNTNSHSAIGPGLLGELIGEIGLADLNILDCIWVNADPYDGPWTSYGDATRLDQLVASTDPVAADLWAATEILIPAFLDNGFNPPWPYPQATPDDPSSAFRNYLDNSMDRILGAGFNVTNDLAQIEAVTWDGTTPLALFVDGFESGGNRKLVGDRTLTESLRVPHRLALLGEVRVVVEWSVMKSLMPWLRRSSRRGEDEPVLVAPGFASDGAWTESLRGFLGSIGYEVRGWGLGRNHGRVPVLVPELIEQVEAYAEKSGQQVRLVGWSLGGYLVREVARERPDLVDRVVTLGAPVVGGPKYTASAPMYLKKGYDLDEIERGVAGREATPIQVPIEAVYSRTDGIVAWRACIDHHSPDVRHHAVVSSHLGLVASPSVFRLVARLMRD